MKKHILRDYSTHILNLTESQAVKFNTNRQWRDNNNFNSLHPQCDFSTPYRLMALLGRMTTYKR